MVSPQLRPVSLVSMPTARCSLGCDVLDHFFAGGVPTGSITEFVGELVWYQKVIGRDILSTGLTGTTGVVLTFYVLYRRIHSRKEPVVHAVAATCAAPS